MDYLTGVTYLHLLPLLKPRPAPNDGGYAVLDYRAVRPDLGTFDDLVELAGVLRRHSIFLTLDLVLNHVAEEHDWAVQARYHNSLMVQIWSALAAKDTRLFCVAMNRFPDKPPSTTLEPVNPQVLVMLRRHPTETIVAVYNVAPTFAYSRTGPAGWCSSTDQIAPRSLGRAASGGAFPGFRGAFRPRKRTSASPRSGTAVRRPRRRRRPASHAGAARSGDAGSGACASPSRKGRRGPGRRTGRRRR